MIRTGWTRQSSLWRSCVQSESDPWAWRHMLADHPEIAYGKFFNRKAGFLHKDWFPVFASYRRNGYDFDALCDDELAPYKWKNAMEQFFLDDQLVGKVLPASDIKEESIKTDLQMRTYLITMGFTQKRNKKGQPYGWHLATLGTPETKWGYDFVTSAYSMSPQNCWETIRGHMLKLYPAASDDALWSLLGMRILAANTPADVKPAKVGKKNPGRKPHPKTTPPDKSFPGNLITKIDGNIPLPISEDQFAGLRYAISTLEPREQDMSSPEIYFRRCRLVHSPLALVPVCPHTLVSPAVEVFHSLSECMFF